MLLKRFFLYTPYRPTEGQGLLKRPIQKCNQNKTIFRISDSELRSKMSELVKGHEEIINLSAYKRKLFDEQLTQLISYHAFVVLETDEWWWSVEKMQEGITIQRSKKLKYVKDR